MRRGLLLLVLLPWWLLMMVLPVLLVIWVLIGLAYVSVMLIILLISTIRALSTRHRARSTEAGRRGSAVETGASTQSTELASTPHSDATTARRGPPVGTSASGNSGGMPLIEQRRVAYDMLAAMDSIQFTEVMHDLFSALGFFNVTVMPGITALTMLDPSLDPVVAQCVPFSPDSDLKADVVRQTLSLRAGDGARRLAIVTLLSLTDEAKELALHEHVSLYETSRILDLFERAEWLPVPVGG